MKAKSILLLAVALLALAVGAGCVCMLPDFSRQEKAAARKAPAAPAAAPAAVSAPSPEEPQQETAPSTPRQKAAAPPTSPPEGLVHTVTWPGETLSLIAKWYTGSWANWRKIAAANPKLNPDRIEIGDRIIIPAALLKTTKPMPREMVPQGKAKKSPAPAKPTTPASETQEPAEVDLFGPKQ